MVQYSGDAHWRDSSRTARFFFVDARAVFPLVLWMMHIRWWTFWVAIVSMIFFAILERWGFTVPVFFRWLRSFIAGPYRTATPWWRE